MAGLDHTSRPSEPRDLPVEQYNARLGLMLFAIYLLGYVAYVLVNAFWPSVMDIVPFAGLNLAVISGMALIVSALIIAVVYSLLCQTPKRGQS